MSATPAPNEGIRNYQFVSGLALGVLFFLQVQLDLASPEMELPLALSVVMVGAGALGIFTSRSASPLVVLLPMGANQFFHRLHLQRLGDRWGHDALLRPMDLALCMAALAYAAAHYRLLSLRAHAVPPDPRLKAVPGVTPVRAAHLAPPQEFVSVLVLAPLFALVAQAVWFLMVWRWQLADLQPEWGRFLLFTWALALGLFATGQLFRTWRRRQMDETTARLLLQDELWRETRGEQRRINRWLAWIKVKRQEE